MKRRHDRSNRPGSRRDLRSEDHALRFWNVNSNVRPFSPSRRFLPAGLEKGADLSALRNHFAGNRSLWLGVGVFLTIIPLSIVMRLKKAPDRDPDPHSNDFDMLNY